MPTPVAHTLAGYVVARVAPRRSPLPLWLLGLSLVVANSPDLDFIPGLVVGRPGAFHSGISHSLGFALLVSGLAAAFVRWKTGQFWPAFGLFMGVYLSHLLFDFLNPDGRPPYGIPFWWPLSGEYFISPAPVFLGVHHSGSAAGTTIEFIRSVANQSNVRAVLYEIVVLAPFVLFGEVLDRWRRSRKPGYPEPDQAGKLRNGRGQE